MYNCGRKTTLLNYVLETAPHKRIAVIENEFGDEIGFEILFLFFFFFFLSVCKLVVFLFFSFCLCFFVS